MSIWERPVTRALAVMLMLGGLSACASLAPVPDEPAALTVVGDGPHSPAIIDAQGGAPARPLAMTETSNDAFLTALQASLEAAYAGDEASPETTTVKVSFADPYRAWMGLDMTVSAKLLSEGRPAEDWRALLGEARSRAAIRANIADFIQSLRVAMRANARATVSSQTVLTANR